MPLAKNWAEIRKISDIHVRRALVTCTDQAFIARLSHAFPDCFRSGDPSEEIGLVPISEVRASILQAREHGIPANEALAEDMGLCILHLASRGWFSTVRQDYDPHVLPMDEGQEPQFNLLASGVVHMACDFPTSQTPPLRITVGGVECYFLYAFRECMSDPAGIEAYLTPCAGIDESL